LIAQHIQTSAVPSELLGGLGWDAPVRNFIMEQDREIAEKSGRPPL
jgi:hypothetical protein